MKTVPGIMINKYMGTGDTAQWYSGCLPHGRPWVQSLASPHPKLG
jgi:hypothetical protein